ncbi:hypothetical protein R1sor_019618 [Riccia sorocarpa]|uniref:Uncharacterized protein n=1 Tax=Riccia sorocarpa TaxID=122646 RepID=A0ABD3IE46_9MARC
MDGSPLKNGEILQEAKRVWEEHLSEEQEGRYHSDQIDMCEVITEEGQILKLIEDTYRELYSVEVEGPEATELRSEVLAFSGKKANYEAEHDAGWDTIG